MKSIIFSFLAAAFLAAFLMSCVSMQDRVMTPQEQEQVTIIDTVTDRITIFQLFHVPQKDRIKAKAYSELMRIARQKYQGDIDIRNITITGKLSALQTPFIAAGGVGVLESILLGGPPGLAIGIPVAVAVNLIFGFKSINATGDVVAIGDVSLINSARSGSTAPVPANVPGNAPAPSNTPTPGNAPVPGANF